MIDEIDVDGKGSGQSGNEGEKSLSVRFTGSVEAQHRKLGTSSVAAACLRVQRSESGGCAVRFTSVELLSNRFGSSIGSGARKVACTSRGNTPTPTTIERK